MRKSINPRVIEIQRRFFEALELAITTGRISGGMKGFCDKYKLNRTKYNRIKNDLGKPLDQMLYKSIDIDALADICIELGVSSDWLLLGRGKMMKPKDGNSAQN